MRKADYESKLQGRENLRGPVLKEIPERVILISDTLESPTLDNLWNYLGHFYDKVTPALKDSFDFEDLAGIYTEGGVSRLFAVCKRYVETDGLKTLPGGKYLCANCDEERREADAGRPAAHCRGGIRLLPRLHGAAHRRFRHPALEL